MRLLIVAESPPTTDPVAANGSTMVTANVIPLLGSDIDIDLVYFRDRDVGPDQAVLDRVRSVTAWDVHPPWRGWLSQLTGNLPRATGLRAVPAERIRSLTREVDAVYLHGLHTAALGPSIPRPKTIHIIDPWSHHWRQQASEYPPLHRIYLLDQARRAAALEQDIAGWAYATFVVNPADAIRLSEQTGGFVCAVPNGVSSPSNGKPSTGPMPEQVTVDPNRICFVGTLNYPPNLEALHRLVEHVWPLVKARRPDGVLSIAGRNPTPWLTRLQEPGIEVLGPVPDPAREFARSAAAAYVGRTGRGTKNTVSEALAAGCPVVASPESARGQADNPGLVIAETDAALADTLVSLMIEGATRPAPTVHRTWAEAAHDYERVIRASAARQAD